MAKGTVGLAAAEEKGGRARPRGEHPTTEAISASPHDGPPRSSETEGAAPRGYIPRAGRSDWRTPELVLELVRQLFGGSIGLDPCAAPNPAHSFAKVNLSGPAGSPADGLVADWYGAKEGARVFVNPPFDELAAWTKKCAHEAEVRGAEVVLLMPARVDTRFWHDVVLKKASAVCLWKGRIAFVGAPSTAPFPVALVYFGPRPHRFVGVFGDRGWVVLL